MRQFGFVVRRARSGAVLLGALLAVTAVLTGSLGVIVATADAVLDRGVRAVVAGAPSTGAGMQVQTKRADDAATQNADVDAAIATAFPSTEVDVTREVRSSPLDAELGGMPTAVVLLAGEDVVAGAELVAGEWPAPGSRQVVLHAAAAERLGVEPGDAVRLGADGDDDGIVLGLWRPLDETDPRWFGDPTVASGFEGADALVIVDESAMGLSPLRPSVAWTIVPRDAGVADLPGLAAGVGTLRTAIQDLGSGTGESWRVTGSLPETLDRAATAAASGRALLIVPIVLLGVLGATAVVLVARALAVARRDEDALLRSRGRSRGRQAGDDLLETGPVALAGIAAGGAAVLLVTSADGIPLAVAAMPLAVVALGARGETLLTQELLGGVEVASGLLERLLAVHHPGAGALAQGLDVLGGE